MKEIINIKSIELMYYILAFFYIATDFILSVIHWDINKLGQRRRTAKVIILFLVVLILINIFFSSLTIYFLIPITSSVILFLLIDKNAHYVAGSKFSYFADEVWKNILTFCKNWFGYGLLGTLVGLLIAILQVQIFQGGNGGLFALKNICIEYSANATDCLLKGTSTQIIGDRLALVMLIYGGQAFIWTGLILALLKDKGKILTGLGIVDLIRKNKWSQKIDDFRKAHYI
jgi:hypothetical protein